MPYLILFIAIWIIWGIVTEILEKPKYIKCKHGVRGGDIGKCDACEEEKSRLVREQQEKERKELIKKKAKEYRKLAYERIDSLQFKSESFIRRLSPQNFENYISKLYTALGYVSIQTPYSNDGGKDIILRKDNKKYVVECKLYSASNSIGRPDIQKFYAAMHDEKADCGIYINTGRYTDSAVEYAGKNGIILYTLFDILKMAEKAYPTKMDEKEPIKMLCEECGEEVLFEVLMNKQTRTCLNGHEVVLAPRNSVIKDSWGYCPECEKPMIRKHGRYGWFYSCPDCWKHKKGTPPTNRVLY